MQRCATLLCFLVNTMSGDRGIPAGNTQAWHDVPTKAGTNQFGIAQKGPPGAGRRAGGSWVKASWKLARPQNAWKLNEISWKLVEARALSTKPSAFCEALRNYLAITI